MAAKHLDTAELTKEITRLLSKEGYKPLRRSDIAARLRIRSVDRVAFRRLLKDLVRKGSIVRVKGGRHILPGEEELVTGVLRGHRRGFGFVVPTAGKTPDIYIHRENMSTALDGDTVLVRPIHDFRRNRQRAAIGPEGEIVEVIKRANSTITGTLQRSGNLYYVVPDNLALFNDVYVDPSMLKGARDGDKVVCRITEWTSRHLNPEGRIVKGLGSSRQFSSEIKAVIERFDLPKGFSNSVRRQVKEMSEEIPSSEISRRVDFRDRETFTIDPVRAKDFDDAVSLEFDEARRTYTLCVHIADVAWYVPEGSPLDEESLRRGNSYYLADTVVSMLPKRLSNDLCSLKPHVPRLTKSAVMKFTEDGELAEYDLCDGIIRSSRRFTYEEVLAILEGKETSEFAETLRTMSAFSEILRQRRRERGSITFDMPEIEAFVGPDGFVSSLKKTTSDRSHTLIEEFMLAANETVASHLAANEISTIYRVHDDPKEGKLADFVDTARHLGFHLPKSPSHDQIQQLLNKVHGEPIAPLINLAYLKTMKLAQYSTENIGHFGLASERYVHFTSPIRRYPDLVVHRCLNATTSSQSRARENRKRAVLTGVAESCSESERKADEAEKALNEMAVLHYLRREHDRKKRNTHKGVISEVNAAGMRVFLDDFLIEGLVKMSSLVSDYFRVNRKARKLEGVRSRKTYAVGQRVQVRVKQVDLIGKEIELVLVQR